MKKPMKQPHDSGGSLTRRVLRIRVWCRDLWRPRCQVCHQRNPGIAMGICGQCWSLARHEVEKAHDADIDQLLIEHQRMLVALRRISGLPAMEDRYSVSWTMKEIAREALLPNNEVSGRTAGAGTQPQRESGPLH